MKFVKQAAFVLLDTCGINIFFRRLNRGKIRVLLLHNIIEDHRGFNNALTPRDLESMIVYLKQRYAIIGMDQQGNWIGYHPDKVNLLLTFDDGFRGNLDFAVPILRKHGLIGVFLIIADCMTGGGASPIFTHASQRQGLGDETTYRTIDRDGARSMIDAGMCVGSHSRAHTDYRTLGDDELIADATSSRAILERELGAPIDVFAFPWGYHNPAQLELLTRIYRRVFMTTHGFCNTDDTVIPRNEVADFAHLKITASGALDKLRPSI